MADEIKFIIDVYNGVIIDAASLPTEEVNFGVQLEGIHTGRRLFHLGLIPSSFAMAFILLAIF